MGTQVLGGGMRSPQMLVVSAHLPSSPGDYFPEKSTKHVFDSAPSHSISARTKTFRVDSTPGLPQPSQLTDGMELGSWQGWRKASPT